jgi:hypothetical protein
LVAPGGAETFLTPTSGRISLPPLAQPGLYALTLESTGGEVTSTRFAVNFFNPSESVIAPKPKLDLVMPAEVDALPALPPAHQEWWRLLALGALILLAIEWLVYQRGVLFRYWALLRQHIG